MPTTFFSDFFEWAKREGIIHMKEEILQLLDITGAEHVEVLVRKDRKVIWVNVNGICRLRVCQIDKLEVNDEKYPGE